MHEHYDVDGNLTGRTVVIREPLWDDSDRERAFALQEDEASLCPCGCQQPADEALDGKRAFKVNSATCYARRAIEATREKDAEAAKAQGKPDNWDEGLTYYIEDSFVPNPPGGGS